MMRLFAVTKTGPLSLTIPENAQTLEDLYQGLDLGVYSSLRTFDHNKFLWLDQHLARTVRSMQLLGWAYQLDEENLRNALHTVCSAFPSPEMRVRIDVLATPAQQRGTESRVLIGLVDFTPPPEDLYKSGVAVAFATGLRRPDPLIKTATFVAARKVQNDETTQVYERLLLNEAGEILEGTSSNFYAVRDGTVYTAGAGVLEGVTRKIILDLIPTLGIPLKLAALHVAELSSLDEAAISSSSRGLLPVVVIDGVLVGDGHPGPVCQRIRAAYREFVQREIRTAFP